jgi:hypothetical protein
VEDLLHLGGPGAVMLYIAWQEIKVRGKNGNGKNLEMLVELRAMNAKLGSIDEATKRSADELREMGKDIAVLKDRPTG